MTASKKAKKAAADDKMERMKTGGGSYNQKMDAMDDQILAILGHRGQPLCNIYDSDAAYNADGEYSLVLQECLFVGVFFSLL